MARLVLGEFQKLFSTRLWFWLLLGSLGLTVLFGALAIAFGDDPGKTTPPLSSAGGQRTVFSVGFGGGAAFAAVLGAVGATSEFRHRTAVSTFLCTPRRSRVVIAKLITYGLAGLGFGAACAAASIALAVPYLQAKGIEVALPANGIPATLGAVVVAVALYAVIGTGLGALLREQVATTVGLLVYLFVAEPVITRVGASLEWTTWLPGSAAGAMLDVSQAGQVYLPAWQGGLVLAGYAAVLAVAGAVALARRDVH